MMKTVITRIIDILFALVGLLCLLLILPCIALLIKIDSRGPIFHRCTRVGRDGKLFQMYKFRTMYESPLPLGASISPQGDPRVTPVGQVLRRLKLNEFPQFLNVLKGDMTLIGPRPEAPDLAAAYPEAARAIFSVKPGLAGPNQILGRNEEELYPLGVDPVKYYIEQLLPRKLPLDLAYINDKSIFKNLKYLLLSVKVTLTGAITRRHLADNRTQIYLMLADMALCLASFSLAHYLRFEGLADRAAHKYFQALLPWVVLVRLPIFIYFGFYYTLIRHISLFDIKTVSKGVFVSSLLLICASFFLGLSVFAYSRAVFIIDWLCLTTLLIGYRALLKGLYQWKIDNHSGTDKKQVLIWGAGDAGEFCLRYLRKDKRTNYEVVGFIDDEPLKRNRRLEGVKVLGNRHHLKILKQLYKIQEVFLAMPNLSEAELHEVLQICTDLRLPVKLFQLQTISSPGFTPQPQSGQTENSFSAELSPRLSMVSDQRK
jgi:lipopolysaccharide/colanic/teichoic acid biosynthesis glycosyltransferase